VAKEASFGIGRPAAGLGRSTVLEKFKKGENTATVYQDPNKGKVSDVGQ
jgi:hypothetical protein